MRKQIPVTNGFRIAIVGLGYVGLPLAIALARKFTVTGFDIDTSRLTELRAGTDRTGETDSDVLRSISIAWTDDERSLRAHDVYIVTVPTPVDAANRPDLTAVQMACRTVGRHMSKGAIVVLESTVYPGVTEDICGPELESASGMTCGHDFFLGYSPERINPGDRVHTIERITKVIAGQTQDTSEKLAEIYGAVTSGGVFAARNIKTAEAAKVIENAQRDINVAFINEVTTIFARLGISIYDVLDASRTKWNFLDFKPGLVGGHCIGVDPYYLAYCSQTLGHEPEIILAGRRINDDMASFLAEQIHKEIGPRRPAQERHVLVLGLTFKENVADLRNSKVVDLVRRFKEYRYAITIHDPIADPKQVEHLYDVRPIPTLAANADYDAIVGAVPHAEYTAFDAMTLSRMLREDGLVADIKGIWRHHRFDARVRYWTP